MERNALTVAYVQVVCRFRPQNSTEIKEGGEPVVEFLDDQSVKIESKEAGGTFAFDRVFAMNTRQEDIFNYSIKSIVDGEHER